MSKKVSIVIITYNQQEFVHETIESCLNQTYENIEIIICDDGSNDKTPNIIKRYADQHPDKIIPILHPINTGIAENSNRGLRICSGDYVIWFGGDDIMLPNKVKLQLDYLESHPQLSACYHDAEVFEWPSCKVLGLFSKIRGSGDFEIIDIKKYLHPKCILLPSTIMLRHDSIKGFLIDVRVKMMNDFLFYAQLLIHGGPFGFLKDPLIKYRTSNKSVCKTEDAMQYGFEEMLITFAILEAKYPNLSGIIEKKTRNVIFNAAATQVKLADINRFKDLCLLGINRGSSLKGSILWILGVPVIKFFYKHQRKFNSMIKFFTKWV